MSRPRKPPSKILSPARVLAIHPPGEIQEQLLEDALEKADIGHVAVRAAVILVDVHGRPGLDRRIDVAEGPFIGGQLAVRMHHPVLTEQQELVLCEFGIDQRQADTMEAEIPGGEPRIFPFVGHRDDVGGIEMAPAAVASELPRQRRRRLARVAVEPFGDVVAIVLLAPEHAREGLALHEAQILVGDSGLEHGIERIGFLAPHRDERIETRKSRCFRSADA